MTRPTQPLGVVPYVCSTCGLAIPVDGDGQEPWPPADVAAHIATHKAKKEKG